MSLSGEAVLYASSPSDKVAQETARRERRRRKVIKELFETEKTYIHHLELVNKFFDFPLRFACLVPDDIHARLFSNLEQIHEVNVTLLVQMEQTTVGQAFSQLGPFLKLYSMYANNHQYALTTLQEWQSKSSEFADFIARQEDRPEVMGLKLPALLITPVQRIPRYKLLLEELLRNTLVDHHDFEKLKEATEKIGDTASHINEHIRQNENFMKVLAIQRNFDSSAPKLLAPGRQFIKEGLLKKVSRKGRKSHERMFFLFSDILLYGKPKFLDGGRNLYTCSCVLPLRHCSVEPVFITTLNKADNGGVFKLSCKDENLLLYSDDQSTAKDWSDEVDRAIRKLCDDRQTLRKPSSNTIPLRGRSLRRHRQEQKKTDIKIPGKTPLRPLSQISVRSEDNENSDNSPSVKTWLEPMKKSLKHAYSTELSAFGDENHTDDTISPDLESSCPVPRKRKRSNISSSGLSGISLSDSSGSLSDSLADGQSLRSDTCSTAVLNCLTEGGGRKQSLRQYSFSLRGSRSQLTDKGQADVAPQQCQSREQPANCTGKLASLPETSSSSSVWFPPNSPAHHHHKRKTFNMRLRSYFQRFQRMKKEVTDNCSPFKPKTATFKREEKARRKRP